MAGANGNFYFYGGRRDAAIIWTARASLNPEPRTQPLWMRNPNPTDETSLPCKIPQVQHKIASHTLLSTL